MIFKGFRRNVAVVGFLFAVSSLVPAEAIHDGSTPSRAANYLVRNIGALVSYSARVGEEVSRDWGTMCTATLISPSVAITAAHCIASRNMKVVFADDANRALGVSPGDSIPVVDYWVFPELATLAAKCDGCSYADFKTQLDLYTSEIEHTPFVDIALVKLFRPVAGTQGVRISRYSFRSSGLEKMTLFGYGVRGSLENPKPESDLSERVGLLQSCDMDTIPLDGKKAYELFSFYNHFDHRLALPDFAFLSWELLPIGSVPDGRTNANVVSRGSCLPDHGDSGGPLFLNYAIDQSGQPLVPRGGDGIYLAGIFFQEEIGPTLTRYRGGGFYGRESIFHDAFAKLSPGERNPFPEDDSWEEMLIRSDSDIGKKDATRYAGSGLIEDPRTGLIWSRSDSGPQIYQDDAGQFCQEKGMRLPSVSELLGILDIMGGYGTTPCGTHTCGVSRKFRLSTPFQWSSEQSSLSEGSAVALDGSGVQRQISIASKNVAALCVLSSNMNADEKKGVAPGSNSGWSHISIKDILHPPAQGVTRLPDSEVVTLVDPTSVKSGGAAVARGQGAGSTQGMFLEQRSGLMWTESDSGSEIKWKQASSYCASRGARLPTVAELKSIFDHSGSGSGTPCGEYTCKVSGKFHLSGPYQWSSEPSGATMALTVNLATGMRFPLALSGPLDAPALCVRLH